MKAKKGEAGYITSRKKKVVIKCIIEFGIAIAIFILGVMQTKTRLNMLTVVALLGCLPAARALVEVIMILPHKTIDKQKVREIETAGEELMKIFDTIFTNEKKIMPVESVVIRKNTVCGYTSKEKAETQVIENHLKQYLAANHITSATVKIFKDYTQYLNRLKEMNELEAGDSDDAIRSVILNLSI